MLGVGRGVSKCLSQWKYYFWYLPYFNPLHIASLLTFRWNSLGITHQIIYQCRRYLVLKQLKHCLTNSCSSCCPSWAIPLGKISFLLRTESSSPFPNPKHSFFKTLIVNGKHHRNDTRLSDLVDHLWHKISTTHIPTLWWDLLLSCSQCLHLHYFLLLLVIWSKIMKTNDQIDWRCSSAQLSSFTHMHIF